MIKMVVDHLERRLGRLHVIGVVDGGRENATDNGQNNLK
jgi:hypothetical protein